MEAFDGDDLERRYLTGESLAQIAKSLGVSVSTVCRRLDKIGIKRRSISEAHRSRTRATIDDRDIARRYREGESELSISTSIGVSRCLIRCVLERTGEPIRGRSEASSNRMAKLTEEERLELTDAAHAAVRGVPQSEQHAFNIARGREANWSQWASPAELEIARTLTERGIDFTPQKAVGPYNIDLAIAESSIAVEVFGGGWHAHGSHATRYRERTDYLLDRGWMPIIVWATFHVPLGPGAAEYVIAQHEIRRSRKPERCCEHVIRGDGYGGPVPESEPKCPSIIPGRQG
jgi:very-short-patch-repair endonuclease